MNHIPHAEPVDHPSEKSAAPALDRGPTVLELLVDGPLLEQCARNGCPASLLRIMDTLIHRGHMQR